MIVDGASPPSLREFSRKPREFEDGVRQLADRFDCTILAFWWNEYSWDAYVTFEADDDVKAAHFLRHVEAYGVKHIVTTEEKERFSSETGYPQEGS